MTAGPRHAAHPAERNEPRHAAQAGPSTADHAAPRHAVDTRPGPRPLTDLASAIGFLTLLPIGHTWPDGRPPRSVGWYAWAGALIGALGAGVAALGRLGLTNASPVQVAVRSLVLASVVVAGWAVLTRFLHWDGLADTFDGIWGGATTERRLEIMRDSRIGSFGAAAMVMCALVQVAAVTGVVATGRLWFLVAAPMLGRLAASIAAWTMPAARRDGLGLTAMERPAPYDVAVAVAATAALIVALALLDPVRGLVVILVGLAAAAVVPALLARQVGGMTGDLFGATVLLVETLVLLVAGVM